MYDGIYTPALSRSDAAALRDLLRPAPLDEARYIARRDAFDDLRRRVDPSGRHWTGRPEGRRNA